MKYKDCKKSDTKVDMNLQGLSLQVSAQIIARKFQVTSSTSK